MRSAATTAELESATPKTMSRAWATKERVSIDAVTGLMLHALEPLHTPRAGQIESGISSRPALGTPFPPAHMNTTRATW
jgi:hypothetical protein